MAGVFSLLQAFNAITTPIVNASLRPIGTRPTGYYDRMSFIYSTLRSSFNVSIMGVYAVA